MLKGLPAWLAWLASPVLSRGEFSPRLFMGWQVFYLLAWVVVNHELKEPKILNGVLVQPEGIGEIVVTLAALIVSAWGLGALQKIQLSSDQQRQAVEDDPTDEDEAEQAPDEAERGRKPENYCPPETE